MPRADPRTNYSSCSGIILLDQLSFFEDLGCNIFGLWWLDNLEDAKDNLSLVPNARSVACLRDVCYLESDESLP